MYIQCAYTMLGQRAHSQYKLADWFHPHACLARWVLTTPMESSTAVRRARGERNWQVQPGENGKAKTVLLSWVAK